ELLFIIDHMNLTLEIAKARAIKSAIDEVVALAKYPNVSVKLSSSPTYSLEAYPWRDMTEHLKRCFDAFGPQRCYWGTDLTNAFTKSTYRQRITHFTEELAFLSEDDKDWVMGRAIVTRLGWASASRPSRGAAFPRRARHRQEHNTGGLDHDASIAPASPRRHFGCGAARRRARHVRRRAGAEVQGGFGEDAGRPHHLGAGLGQPERTRNPLHPRLLPQPPPLDQAGHEQARP